MLLDYRNLCARTTMLAKAECSFLQQRAKCAYLKSSDRFMKFFHDLVKRNNKRNSIADIMKANGESTTSLSEVAGEFVAY